MKNMRFFINARKVFRDIPEREKRITLATCFTIARIVLTPFIVTAMLDGLWMRACTLFAIAGLTDLFDGLCARYLNQKTFLGACLDPVADKVLMISCFCTLAFIDSSFFYIPLWFIAFVLSKELLQIIGGCILYLYRGQVAIEPTILGKVVTVAQIFLIVWLCVNHIIQWIPGRIDYFLHVLVVLMSISCAQYIYIGIQIFKKGWGVSYE